MNPPRSVMETGLPFERPSTYPGGRPSRPGGRPSRPGALVRHLPPITEPGHDAQLFSPHPRPVAMWNLRASEDTNVTTSSTSTSCTSACASTSSTSSNFHPQPPKSPRTQEPRAAGTNGTFCSSPNGRPVSGRRKLKDSGQVDSIFAATLPIVRKALASKRPAVVKIAVDEIKKLHSFGPLDPYVEQLLDVAKTHPERDKIFDALTECVTEETRVKMMSG